MRGQRRFMWRCPQQSIFTGSFTLYARRYKSLHSMYRLIFSTLHASIICGILAMILVAIVLCCLAYRLRKKIMRPKLLLFILLIGYIAALLYTTILRYVGSTSGFNFHLFRAWREAWNTFSTTSFLNVILSIAIYIPFGALCPMIWKQMRKWWSVALVAILLSTSIEAIQYVKSIGIFDVDDIFCNVLGAMLGYCLSMFITNVSSKNPESRQTWATYAILPICVIMFGGIGFCRYYFQTYGNLPCAPTYYLDTSRIEWTNQASVGSLSDIAPVYKISTSNTNSSIELASLFEKQLGIKFNRVDYYDDSTWFIHQGEPYYKLVAYTLDGTFEYSSITNDNEKFTQASEDIIRNELNKFSIVPPIDAVFSYAGNGWHIFSATVLSVDNELLNGTIRCKYTESGKITHIEQHMLKFTIDSQGKIIPLDKACQAVYRGEFKSNTSFEQMGLTNVTVNSIKLEYEVDTKKFLQPVYAFYLTGKDYEERIIIPALQ